MTVLDGSPTATLPTTPPTATAIVEPSGRLRLASGYDEVVVHPLWLRDRSDGPGDVDPANRQRLYEPTDVGLDVVVVAADASVDGSVRVAFSDGVIRRYHARTLIDAALGAPDALPEPVPWTANSFDLPGLPWSDVVVGDTHRLLTTLDTFHRAGCFVITGAPARDGALREIATAFGRISSTNFGELFDVRSVVDAEDLAYTPVGLAAHTDQPYRTPTPGLQFLHTITNSASGGESTVVDGLAAVEALRANRPDVFDVLATTPVEWRYDIGTDVVVATAPVIDLAADGRLRQLRFSPRLDFPAAVDTDVLDAWYLGRRLLAEWFDDPHHRVEFKMRAGDVLVVDNHRVLHGRRPFDPTSGHRHLQGCYIDHDGPATMLRLLRRRIA